MEAQTTSGESRRASAAAGAPAPDRAAQPAPTSQAPSADHRGGSAEGPAPSEESLTYLLVDGENIDATLGMSILGRRPHSEERPRWNKLLTFLRREWGAPVRGLFFLAVDGDLPASFVQALLAIGYQPIMLRGEGKVVDIAIQRTADALVDRPANVALASHDRDFVPQMARLAEDPDRHVGVLGFSEFLSNELRRIPHVEFFDLEYDAQAFTAELPRLRVIDIAEFDPLDFL